MKYRIEPNTGFRPFEVTFVIETKEEARWFHDNVACKVAESGGFLNSAYRAYSDKEFDGASGPLNYRR